FGSWLVTAMAITVPERLLKVSSLKTTTGRRPACSEPRVGARSAQRMSPLNMAAIRWRQLRVLSRQRPVLPAAKVWHIRAPAGIFLSGPTSLSRLFGLLRFGFEKHDSSQGDRDDEACVGRWRLPPLLHS